MIWDEIRKQAPSLRRPEIQVIRIPFELCSRQGAESINDMLPKTADGTIDMSWIRPPFNEFVIVTPGNSDCALVRVNPSDLVNQAWECDFNFSSELIFRGAGGMSLGPMDLAFVKNGTLQRGAPGVSKLRLETPEFLGLRSDLTGLPCLDTRSIDDAYLTAIATTLSKAAVVTMALMSCKNVSRRQVMPPRQQRRAAERSGLPLVSWHELVVTGQTGSSGSIGSGEGHNALHWVRGHFKDYREKGLFGSQKGVYWWSPHLAGQADRVVLKDYEISETASQL